MKASPDHRVLVASAVLVVLATVSVCPARCLPGRDSPASTKAPCHESGPASGGESSERDHCCAAYLAAKQSTQPLDGEACAAPPIALETPRPHLGAGAAFFLEPRTPPGLFLRHRTLRI